METDDKRKYREWREIIHGHEESTVTTLWASGKRETIKGGTLRDLVYSITGKRISGSDALTALLLTYRSYGSPTELLDILIERFHVCKLWNAPVDMSFDEFFATYLKQPVQIQYVALNVILRMHTNLVIV